MAVFADMFIKGYTDLYIIRIEALMVQRYTDEIPKNIAVFDAAAIEDKFVIMDDNVMSHRAQLVDNFLFDEKIIRMDSDMNPIEHVWKLRGRRVTGSLLPPKTHQQLENSVLKD